MINQPFFPSEYSWRNTHLFHDQIFIETFSNFQSLLRVTIFSYNTHHNNSNQVEYSVLPFNTGSQIQISSFKLPCTVVTYCAVQSVHFLHCFSCSVGFSPIPSSLPSRGWATTGSSFNGLCVIQTLWFVLHCFFNFKISAFC